MLSPANPAYDKNMITLVITRFKLQSAIFHMVTAAAIAWFIQELMIIEFAFAWFFAVNMVAFVSFGFDKLAAKGGKGRTPEVTYHILGLLGGFPAIFAGRRMFNHKTKKAGFFVPMWILFIAQILATSWYFGNLDKVYYKWEESFEQAQQQKAAPAPTKAPSQTKK